MKLQHTQGPWEAWRESHEPIFIVASSKKIAKIYVIDKDKDNARLIAAAPELLECLIDEELEDTYANPKRKAIIEKATGKTWAELTEPDIPTAAIEIGETVTCPQCKTMRFTPCIDPGDEFTCTNCGIVFKAGKTIRSAKEKPPLFPARSKIVTCPQCESVDCPDCNHTNFYVHLNPGQEVRCHKCKVIFPVGEREEEKPALTTF